MKNLEYFEFVVTRDLDYLNWLQVKSRLSPSVTSVVLELGRNFYSYPETIRNVITNLLPRSLESLQTRHLLYTNGTCQVMTTMRNCDSSIHLSEAQLKQFCFMDTFLNRNCF